VHGCVIHYGNAKARANAWNLPDPVPVHREPIYTPRPDLVAKYPTLPDEGAVPRAQYRLHDPAGGRGQGYREAVPAHLTSGRLVEYEGGGEETRSNKWLAELQQDMFVEINPGGCISGAASPTDSGSGSRVRRCPPARLPRQGAGHRARRQGWPSCPSTSPAGSGNVDQRSKYPQGTDPIVLGESVNTVTGYGYDPVTGMQEGKARSVRSEAA
jgi:formate dehydrogenase major subunit